MPSRACRAKALAATEGELDDFDLHTSVASQDTTISLAASEAVKRTKEDVIRENREKALAQTEGEVDDFDLSTSTEVLPEGMSEEERALRTQKKMVRVCFFFIFVETWGWWRCNAVSFFRVCAIELYLLHPLYFGLLLMFFMLLL